MECEELSASQANALFDILTHHEARAEIEGLKYSHSVATFGTPISSESPVNVSSPMIQLLLKKCTLVLPGLRDVSSEFWSKSIFALATALDDSNLSDSYDKGSVGIRRTLSTASAAMVEYCARGILGGYVRRPIRKGAHYDTSKPEDLISAWDDFVQQLLYGDLLEKLFRKAAETDKLSDHEPVVQALHKYVVAMFDPQCSVDYTKFPSVVSDKQVE